MESTDCSTRSTLQRLETQYLALEMNLIQYIKDNNIYYIEEIKAWLTFITRFPIEERTLLFHCFVSILIDEGAKIKEDNFIKNVKQQLEKEELSNSLITQLMKMYDVYRRERE